MDGCMTVEKLFFALHICGFFDGLNTPFHGTFDVNSGTSAPWFDQPGGGTQYQLPMSIREKHWKTMFYLYIQEQYQ